MRGPLSCGAAAWLSPCAAPSQPSGCGSRAWRLGTSQAPCFFGAVSGSLSHCAAQKTPWPRPARPFVPSVYRRVGGFWPSKQAPEPRLVGRPEATTRREAQMRAQTKGKHGMGKRFAILIGVAAVGVIAPGAQTVIAKNVIERPNGNKVPYRAMGEVGSNVS